MGASVEMMLELGPEHIEARVLDLADKCAQVLEAAEQRSSIADRRFFLRASPIAMSRNFRDAEGSAHRRSARHGRLRVSTHFYNDESDLEKLRNALSASVQAAKGPIPC